jgi:4-hydroxybenzoate polyprenyltransferase
MGLLQTSIGATNDLCDVEHDRLARPEKPLPSGAVARGAAASYAAVAAMTGLGISFGLGPLPGAIAVAGLATGLAYDVRLNRTRWSWLPFAVGLPLLPAFGWAAATSTLPAGLPVLLVLGAVAGAALALANGLVDIEDDASAGRGGLAYSLGRRRARNLLPVLHVVLLLGAGWVLAAGTRPPVALAAFTAGAALIVGGAFGSGSASPAMRERAWEAQAVGVATLALAWLAGTQPIPLR